MHNPRNPATYSMQRQHGSHSASCGCMQGKHIWDTEYDGRGENWCVCCEHFFSTDDDAEFAAVENAIEMNETVSNKKPIQQPDAKPGLRKGKIVRRV